MIDTNILLRAYRLMSQTKVMAETYEANRSICKYVHSTSRAARTGRVKLRLNEVVSRKRSVISVFAA